jgi:Peptidase family S41
MNKSILPSLLLLAVPVFGADALSPVSAPAPDPVAEVLPVLQSSYPGFAALHYQTGNHLSDLIARSNGQIILDSVSAGPTPIFTAALPDGIIYWRLASFTPKKDWADLANDLRQAIKSDTGAVLDLRSNTTPDDYAGAAQVASLFAPDNTSLDKYLPEKGAATLHLAVTDHVFQGPLVVLTNDQTTGAAEALAGCLKMNGALVVGQAATDTASFFDEHKFSNGQALRFAVTPPPGIPPTVAAVVPDIALTVDEHNEKAALSLIREDHVLDVIEESAARHRLSEASLVHGQDPEWDDYLASLEKGPVLLSLPQIHDPVLITALDSLRAIRFSQEHAPTQAAVNASQPAPSSL